MVYIDENFGTYEIRDEEDVEFYREMQRTSVEKQCQGCGRWVRIQPHYAYCNACATRLEQGLDLPDWDPEDPLCVECGRPIHPTEDCEEAAERELNQSPAALRAERRMEEDHR